MWVTWLKPGVKKKNQEQMFRLAADIALLKERLKIAFLLSRYISLPE